MLKQHLDKIIQNEILDSQSVTSTKKTAEECAKVYATEYNETKICRNIESKTLIRNRSGQHFPFEESYLTFVDNSLDDRYLSKYTDFKQIESIIAELDQESKVQIIKFKSIAPFNSNLPVLNISQLESSVPVSPLIAPKLKKTKSTMLNSHGKVIAKNTGTASGLTTKGDQLLSSIYRSSKLSGKKPSTKKRKRTCTKQLSSVNNDINTSQTKIIEEKASGNFENEINNSLAAIMQSSFESMSSYSDVNIQSPKKQMIESDCNAIHVSSNNDVILKNNIENLLLKNMENFVAQQQQIQRQFELRTLYLRRKLDISISASCETLFPGMYKSLYIDSI